MEDVGKQNEGTRKDGRGRVSNKLASTFRAFRRSWRMGAGGRSVPGSRDDRSRRRADGLAAFHAIAGEDGDDLINTLQRLSPAFAHLLVDQVYGEIISRPKLSLRDRELISVATIVALGDVPWALKVHCGGMVRMGWCPREMAETILFAAVGGGVEAFEEAASVACDVLDAHRREHASSSNEPSFAQPIAQDLEALACALYDGSMHAGVLRALKGLRAWEGSPLRSRHRRMIELTRTLVRSGNEAELTAQLERCLLAGWSREQLVELLMHMTVYAGWPPVLNALQPAARTFERFAQEQ